MTGLALDPWITIDDYAFVVDAIAQYEQTREGNINVTTRTDYCTSYGRGATPDGLLPSNFTIGRANAQTFLDSLPAGQFASVGNNTWVNRSILIGARANHPIAGGTGTDYQTFVYPQAANQTAINAGGNDARALRARLQQAVDARLIRGVGTGMGGATITNPPATTPSPPTKTAAKKKRVMSKAEHARRSAAMQLVAARRKAGGGKAGKVLKATV